MIAVGLPMEIGDAAVPDLVGHIDSGVERGGILQEAGEAIYGVIVLHDMKSFAHVPEIVSPHRLFACAYATSCLLRFAEHIAVKASGCTGQRMPALMHAWIHARPDS
jgi:hypothetical protein